MSIIENTAELAAYRIAQTRYQAAWDVFLPLTEFASEESQAICSEFYAAKAELATTGQACDRLESEVFARLFPKR